ncbi:4'-phosphopantetheinyl transferase superfamily protein [Actinoplanes sp. NPDC024001]|uniref:4'-phosphopantetheinyl transferase family protein n=1 Tax=Actinoplanes sp. NPDC024001 TaxID=3154598 RepID=UPI003410B522
MLGSLLPSSVVTAEAFADDEAEGSFPGEEDLVATAAPGRRREFVTARRCAREALAGLGHPPVAIRPGPRREPVWPAGLAGSITHCAGYRAAAVTRTEEVASVGIDAEPHAPLPPRVLGAVTAPGDAEHLARLSRAEPAVHWDRLLFSAKEAVYKAWYPLTRRWLGFDEANLTVDPAAGAFTARLRVDGARIDGGPPLTALHGRYLVERGLVVTAVWVPCR